MAFVYRWQEAVRLLAERLRRQRVLPGENIAVEESADGLRIHSLNHGGGGGGQDAFGYFSMVRFVNQSGERLWKCYDSANPDSTVAGYVCVGAERIAVPVNTFYNPREGGVYVVVSLRENVPSELTGMSYSYTARITSEMSNAAYGVNTIKIGRFVGSGNRTKYYRESDLKIVGYV